MGDLNEILYNHEKEGGRVCPERYRQNFHDVMDECDLEDRVYRRSFYMA
jgi:hypothetical protein